MKTYKYKSEQINDVKEYVSYSLLSNVSEYYSNIQFLLSFGLTSSRLQYWFAWFSGYTPTECEQYENGQLKPLELKLSDSQLKELENYRENNP